MKKFTSMLLVLALGGFQLITVAQPARLQDKPKPNDSSTSVDMQAMREEMQRKMAGAKTDEERQKLMAAQREKMQSIHPQMHAQMGSGDHEHMRNMHSSDHEMHQPMQSRRKQMIN